jgi:hypothetical protein
LSSMPLFFTYHSLCSLLSSQASTLSLLFLSQPTFLSLIHSIFLRPFLSPLSFLFLSQLTFLSLFHSIFLRPFFNLKIPSLFPLFFVPVPTYLPFTTPLHCPTTFLLPKNSRSLLSLFCSCPNLHSFHYSTLFSYDLSLIYKFQKFFYIGR